MFTFLVIVINNNEMYYGQDGLQLKHKLVSLTSILMYVMSP